MYNKKVLIPPLSPLPQKKVNNPKENDFFFFWLCDNAKGSYPKCYFMHEEKKRGEKGEKEGKGFQLKTTIDCKYIGVVNYNST